MITLSGGVGRATVDKIMLLWVVAIKNCVRRRDFNSSSILSELPDRLVKETLLNIVQHGKGE